MLLLMTKWGVTKWRSSSLLTNFTSAIEELLSLIDKKIQKFVIKLTFYETFILTSRVSPGSIIFFATSFAKTIYFSPLDCFLRQVT